MNYTHERLKKATFFIQRITTHVQRTTSSKKSRNEKYEKRKQHNFYKPHDITNDMKHKVTRDMTTHKTQIMTHDKTHDKINFMTHEPTRTKTHIVRQKMKDDKTQNTTKRLKKYVTTARDLPFTDDLVCQNLPHDLNEARTTRHERVWH